MPKKLSRLSAYGFAVTLVLTAACSGVAQTNQNRTEGAGESEVVARIGDHAITLDQVDRKGITSNMTAYQQLYDARNAALEELIDEQLLESEASSRGVTKEELVASEITSKIDPVLNEELEAFYEANKARMGGRPYEQIAPQIRMYLEELSANNARTRFIDELKTAANVTISLSPPRVPVEVAMNEPIKGGESADVTIVEYSDFQ